MKIKGMEVFDHKGKTTDNKTERKSYGPVDLKTARRDLKKIQEKENGTYVKQKGKTK